MRNSVRKASDVTTLGHALQFISAALLITLAFMPTAVQAADAFAPAGTKATLSVDYVYESAGQKRREGERYSQEWRVKRSMNLAAELVAQPATAMPTVQAINESQMAELTGKTDKAQAVATQMAPMMSDVQKIMAKCGEDEACISREAQKMGAALQGTPEMAAAMNAKKDAEELTKPGAPRYQAWRPTAQKGTYQIDESVHISWFDAACPRQRCTRDETRKGGGEILLPPGVNTKRNKGAVAGISAVELDSGKNTLSVTLPVSLFPLPIIETITGDETGSGAPTPKGPQKKLHSFRVNAAGGYMHEKPFTVPLKGGWRTQAGEQVMNLKGSFGDAGKLTVRWRFNVQ